MEIAPTSKRLRSDKLTWNRAAYEPRPISDSGLHWIGAPCNLHRVFTSLAFRSVLDLNIAVARHVYTELQGFVQGLLRELNPGPLAPEARIIQLDQAANC